uniref:Uncharacterized protein n=1 Tax=Cajanus cajan TaxID=3821 RepID=A0A151RA35_CAJCA|nr:hypothetical protein KK1_039214 [Cajanus cajan]
MELKNPGRFTLRKQSSLAPKRRNEEAELQNEGDVVDQSVRLMYSAFEGDGRGIDYRTALHVSVCEGFTKVLEFLLQKDAEVDAKDQ